MTSPLDFEAERFQPTGGIASEGVRNQLGRPSLDRISVLVREAVQNSWDAKAPTSNHVLFGFAGYELNEVQRSALRELVFADVPPEESTPADSTALAGYAEELGRPESRHRVLVLFDRGTSGLGGPTRADQPSTGREARDFVDFFRNIGQPPDKAKGGGTYGYGKAALYLASEVHTIIAYTRCSTERSPETRLMVSTLTNHYRAEDELFTGRHWWGRRRDGIVDPLLGTEADEVAARLGIPGFVEDDSLGTSIMILAPRFEGSGQDFVRALCQRACIHFWPKMVAWPHESGPRMRFHASWNGHEVPFPRVEDDAVLSPYAKALTDARRHELRMETEQEVHDVWCKNPKMRLGTLGLRRYAVPEKIRLARSLRDDDTKGDPRAGLLDKVALLRRAELVVNYVEGPRLGTDHMAYAAVFLADDALDRVYAESEPPTHDSWSPDLLTDKRSRTYIRTTFRRIREHLDSFATPKSSGVAPVAGPPLAKLANAMGSILYGSTGSSARIVPLDKKTDDPPASGNRSKTGSGGSRKKRLRVVVVGRPQLKATPDGPRAVFKISLPNPAPEPARIGIETGVTLVGGARESSPPARSQAPTIVSILDPSGKRVPLGDHIDVAMGEHGEWVVEVSIPEDARIEFVARRLKDRDDG